MTEMMKIVTVTLVNSDGENTSGSCGIDEYTDQAAAIESAKDEAIERFQDNDYSSLEMRCIININTLPKPTLRGTIVEAGLPEQTDSDSVVAATVS